QVGHALDGESCDQGMVRNLFHAALAEDLAAGNANRRLDYRLRPLSACPIAPVPELNLDVRLLVAVPDALLPFLQEAGFAKPIFGPPPPDRPQLLEEVVPLLPAVLELRCFWIRLEYPPER